MKQAIEKTNILSLFDGMSCARIALDQAGITYDNYYASEIDKYAIQVAMKNYPGTIQIGDVAAIDETNIPKDIFLLVGGSPCQSLSVAARQKESGLKKGKSVLFWEYIRVLKLAKPKYFLLENVASMKNTDRDIITKTIGVYPIMINSALVSAQQRKRYYWTNIPGVQQPDDLGIYLKDIVENEVDEKYYYKKKSVDYMLRSNDKWGGAKGNRLKNYTSHPDEKAKCITANHCKGVPYNVYINKPDRIGELGKGCQGDRIYSTNGKSVALSANGGGAGAKTGLYMIQKPRGYNKGGIKAVNGKTPTLSSSSFEHNNHLVEDQKIRKLTPVECERLQTVPDNYTEGVSDTQRYKILGNGFTVKVIEHILKSLSVPTGKRDEQ